MTDQSRQASPAGRSDRAGEVYPRPSAPVPEKRISTSPAVPPGGSAEPQSAPSPAPRTTRATALKSHTVRRGDTLYSIARRHSLSPGDLAALNGITPPYRIYPGQVLRLTGKPPTERVATRPKTTLKPPPRETNVGPTTAAGASKWMWPLPPPPRREFGRGSKGLDFEVGEGTAVQAAHEGSVVYSGSGIGGYERLVIIKHAGDLLSAYSFNGSALVTEQVQVNAGQQVARVGVAGRRAQVVHFELRRNGQPIDPRTVLP